MAAPKRRKRKSPPGAEPVAAPKPAAPAMISPASKRPIQWNLVVLFFLISIGGTYLAIVLRPKVNTPRFTFEIIKDYPHDSKAFTQGLLIQDGFLWESTGRNGESSIRKIDLNTGEILKQVDLDEKYFGEGLAYHDGRFYQLTWKSNKAFVYDMDLNKIGEHEYEGEGWGLTSNGSDLIFSNGTTELRFLDPDTFEIRRSIRVKRGGFRVGQLNELEYAGGKIFANVYPTDKVYEIDPATGDVTSLIELAGLWPYRERPQDGVLNGIAFNPESKKLLFTGKLCPKIFEVDLKPKN